MSVAAPRARQAGVSLWMVLIVLALAAAAGAAAAGFIISRVDLTLLLRDQPLTAIIPQLLEGRGRVVGTLDLHLDETIHTQVPVNQKVTIPIDDTLRVVAVFKGEVPLRMNVRLKDRIPLKQVVEIDTTIDAWLPEMKSTLKVPVRGRIPVDIEVPVDLVIPVDQKVKLDFTTPLTAKIRQNLTVPLRTTLDAAVPINATFDVPVLNELEALVTLPTTPSKAVITHADLELPLRSLQLRLRDDSPETAP